MSRRHPSPGGRAGSPSSASRARIRGLSILPLTLKKKQNKTAKFFLSSKEAVIYAPPRPSPVGPPHRRAARPRPLRSQRRRRAASRARLAHAVGGGEQGGEGAPDPSNHLPPPRISTSHSSRLSALAHLVSRFPRAGRLQPSRSRSHRSDGFHPRFSHLHALQARAYSAGAGGGGDAGLAQAASGASTSTAISPALLTALSLNRSHLTSHRTPTPHRHLHRSSTYSPRRVLSSS